MKAVSPADTLARGDEAEQAGRLDAAIALYSAASRGSGRVAAEATFRLGRVAWRQGRFDEAAASYERARGDAELLGDAELVAACENGLGAVYCERGAYTQARASYRIAFERTANAILRAKILINLGVLANIEGDLDQALKEYRRAAAQFREAGDLAGEALALHNTGMLHADERDWDAADAAYARCLEICERAGMAQMVANVLVNRSEVYCGRGQPLEALSVCERARAIFDDLSDEVGQCEVCLSEGRALRLLARNDLAEQRLREAMRLAERLQTPLAAAEACRELGQLRMATGNPDAARDLLSRSLAQFESLGAHRDVELTRDLLRTIGDGGQGVGDPIS